MFLLTYLLTYLLSYLFTYITVYVLRSVDKLCKIRYSAPQRDYYTAC